MNKVIDLKVDEEMEYHGRKIYHNVYDEYCVCHLWGGMVCFNASFDCVEKAMLYIDNIVRRRDMQRRDFELLAIEIKNIKL